FECRQRVDQDVLVRIIERHDRVPFPRLEWRDLICGRRYREMQEVVHLRFEPGFVFRWYGVVVEDRAAPGNPSSSEPEGAVAHPAHREKDRADDQFRNPSSHRADSEEQSIVEGRPRCPRSGWRTTFINRRIWSLRRISTSSAGMVRSTR